MKSGKIALFLMLTLAVACKPEPQPLTFGRCPEPMEPMPEKIKFELCKTGICEINGIMMPCWDEATKQCLEFKWSAGTPEGDFLRRYVEQQDKLRCMENPDACPRPATTVISR